MLRATIEAACASCGWLRTDAQAGRQWRSSLLLLLAERSNPPRCVCGAVDTFGQI